MTVNKSQIFHFRPLVFSHANMNINILNKLKVWSKYKLTVKRLVQVSKKWNAMLSTQIATELLPWYHKTSSAAQTVGWTDPQPNICEVSK